ncbi:cerebellar degeneration-related protein 2-like [Mytilus galloprovincialis]|uniref:cerebellar degeneration-related protein 2-like n=1 Tax=Mytilus galloprovincialis TaxID=29158 RepID=UPI003F7CC4A3
MHETEDLMDEADENQDWYQNDLHLAAELGKALLETNRELETQAMHLQQVKHEQSLEIEFLSKQLETARDNCDSRMKVYEELDRHNQELEKTNQRLVLDSKGDKQRVEKLLATVEHLEDKCEEYQKKIEEMKKEETIKQRQQKQESRRALSLANLRESSDYLRNIYISDLQWTYNDQFKKLPMNPYEVEIKKLQDSMKQMKAQKIIDKRKQEDLETEVSLLWDENEALDKKNKELEEQIQILEDDLQKSRLETTKTLAYELSKFDPQNVIASEVEVDDTEFTSKGKLVKLDGGGSLYGSTESVNQIAPDTKELSPVDPDKNSVSILNELETQYHNLFQKYEDLLQGKGKRSGSFNEAKGESFDAVLQRQLAVSHKEVQTLLKLHTKDASCGDASAEDPPPYKSIFRDIFATLKKSRIEESGEQPTSASGTPLTSPVCPDEKPVQ